MTSFNQQDVLFDDFSILEKLIGRNELTPSSFNANCDCAGYSDTSDDEGFDPDQIAASLSEAH